MVDVKNSFTMNHTERIHAGHERALEVFFTSKIHDLGKVATLISLLEKLGKL
jgi:hypothetical protein